MRLHPVVRLIGLTLLSYYVSIGWAFAAPETRAQAERSLSNLGMSPELAKEVAGLSTGLAVMPNNTYLVWRNAAGTANLNVIKADGSNNTILNGPTGGSVKRAINGTALSTLSATSDLYAVDIINSTAAMGAVFGEAARAAAVTTATTLAVPLYVSAAAAGTDLGAFIGSGASASGPTVDYFKTRATSGAATTIVASADVLGKIRFLGANGTTYDTGAQIVVTVDGTPGATTDMPGAIDFQVSPDASATPASALKLSNTKAAVFGGTVTSSGTSDLGWTRQNSADQACNTTCVSACVFGWDTAAPGVLLACTDATADSCLCAGAS